MNIHFEDLKLLKQLQTNSLATITVGSHLYGLNDKNSDIDNLSVYLENESNRTSFLWEHHQLQFKEQRTDHNFASIQTFIRNALTGDATINFEVIMSEQIIGTPLEFLKYFRQDFVNYNIIKSYLGLAKRDLKYWKSSTKKLVRHTRETNKQLCHFIRGVIFSKNLLEENFSLDLSKTKTFEYEFKNDLEFLRAIKLTNYTTDISFLDLVKIVEFFEELMIKTRKKLNHQHDKKTIEKIMKPIKLKALDEQIRKISLKHNPVEIDYDELFYSVLSNGEIKY